MKFKILLLFIAGVILGCKVNIEEILGVYVSNNYINNLNTLFILQNGKYRKCTYRKMDNSLIYLNTGSWKYQNGRIIFKEFFNNDDEVFSTSFNNFHDILITTSFDIEKENGKISIDFLEEKGHFKYQKL